MIFEWLVIVRLNVCNLSPLHYIKIREGVMIVAKAVTIRLEIVVAAPEPDR